ncbi:MAG TPA: hypothetical protein VKH37_04120, partial [Ferruginibacter sp.]|nr:hypothetical protein [Ferruginibacter sp.]
LKTIYKAEYITEGGESQEPLKDYMIYAATNPVREPDDFLKNKTIGKAWPLFGEDQMYIPSGEQSMKQAEMGLIVSSPLFYAVDGKRTFRIKFHLAAHEFSAYFIKQATNAGNINDIAAEVIIAEMLRKAFLIDVTAVDKWIRIGEYATACPLDNEEDRFIELAFTLNSDDPAVGLYDPAVHGEGYNIHLPAVRFMMNNNSFPNPYTFLFEQLITRVSITVNVKDSSKLVLQNNIGQLSAANPFQVFGPQPAVGAYLEMKNTNIFNRYTKDFKIKLKWFDLPRIIDGFTEYYKGYNANITNESFKVGLSAMVEDNYLPKIDEQQVFQLFESDKGIESQRFLSDTTYIDDVRLNKIRFDNAALLDQEEKTGFDFKNGSVKLELLEP